jgi:hypothetical protein
VVERQCVTEHYHGDKDAKEALRALCESGKNWLSDLREMRRRVLCNERGPNPAFLSQTLPHSQIAASLTVQRESQPSTGRSGQFYGCRDNLYLLTHFASN